MISEEKTVLTTLRRNEQRFLPILYAQLVEFSDFDPSVKQTIQSRYLELMASRKCFWNTDGDIFFLLST
jgi:hypothetical protein